MGGLAHSFDIDNGKPRNPYGPGGSAGASPKNNSKLFFVICLIFVAVLGIRTILSSGSDPDDVWASKGDAAGGWGSEHHHTIVEHSAGSSSNGAPSQQQQQQPNKPSANTANEASPISDPPKPTNEASYYHEVMKTHKQKYTYGPDQELRMSDFYGELFDLVTVPTAHRPEYAAYQKPDRDYALAEKLLFDLNTPHGMAFDFVLNRDKRRLGPDDPHLVQRFVLALLFYATGGSDENDPKGYAEAHTGGNGGWDSGLAHFLTGLHECHWVKKSMEDQFWGLLSLEGDTDRRVGVTKCNADMEVTEIRLADLNMVGFIPDEIKYLSSLESLDVQNNHLAGHIPDGVGELEELRYLSLDGNNFSGSIPDVFLYLHNLERAYLNFNDFNGAMPPSLCTLREERELSDLWSDCGGYPITCTCCTVCCDMVAECDEMPSQVGGQ